MGWRNVAHLAVLPSKQRVVIIPGDQSEEGIDGCGRKGFEKRKVLKRECKTRRGRSTSGGESWSMTMGKSWVWIADHGSRRTVVVVAVVERTD